MCLEANEQPIKSGPKKNWQTREFLFCFEILWRPEIKPLSRGNTTWPLCYLQERSWCVWRKIKGLHNKINPEKLIAIIDWHSIVLSHVPTPSFGWESNPHPPPLSADLWATGQRGQKVSGGQLPAFILNKSRTKVDLHSILFILCFDGVENLKSNSTSPGNVLRPLCYFQGRLWGCPEDNKQPLHLFWNIKTGPKIDWQIILFFSCFDKYFWCLDAGDWTLPHLEMSSDLCATFRGGCGGIMRTINSLYTYFER